MKRLWKKIVGWFKKEEEILELVVEKKPEHCSSHNRYKKSNAIYLETYNKIFKRKKKNKEGKNDNR